MGVVSIRQRIDHFQRSGGHHDAYSVVHPVDRNNVPVAGRYPLDDTRRIGQRTAFDANGVAEAEQVGAAIADEKRLLLCHLVQLLHALSPEEVASAVPKESVSVSRGANHSFAVFIRMQAKLAAAEAVNATAEAQPSSVDRNHQRPAPGQSGGGEFP